MPDCIKIMYNYLVKYVVDDHTSDIPSNNKQQYLVDTSDQRSSFLPNQLKRFFTISFSESFLLRLASQAKSRFTQAHGRGYS